MAQTSELKQDLDELVHLQSLAVRAKVKDLLGVEIQKLKNNIACSNFVSGGDTKVDESTTPLSAKSSSGSTNTVQRYIKTITTYAWDQSDKFMKIYVTLDNVHTLPMANVKSSFTSRSFKLVVEDLDSKDYTCHVVKLWADIQPDKSYHKVKTNTVTVFLKKAEEKKTWAYVTEKETTKKKEPKLDDKKDPGAGLMDMMRQMYEDGDDEMKRTIAKAWTESREKNSMDL